MLQFLNQMFIVSFNNPFNFYNPINWNFYSFFYYFFYYPINGHFNDLIYIDRYLLSYNFFYYFFNHNLIRHFDPFFDLDFNYFFDGVGDFLRYFNYSHLFLNYGDFNFSYRTLSVNDVVDVNYFFFRHFFYYFNYSVFVDYFRVGIFC